MSKKPIFFTIPDEWRAWLHKNHEKEPFVWLGFYNKGAKKSGISRPEAVEQALCFGWIDGLLNKTAVDSYKLRFTPRRPGSLWSEVNTERAKRLTKLGLMTPAGLAAFNKRDVDRTKAYSYEARGRGFSTQLENAFRKYKTAWAYFKAQPPSYRKTISFWVMDAKQEQTQLKRLKWVIAVSAKLQRVDLVAPFGKRK